MSADAIGILEKFAPLRIGRDEYMSALGAVTPMPVDADGVPWSVDDEEFADPEGKSWPLYGLSLTKAFGWRLYSKYVDDGAWPASKCRHVQKRDPVEELLEEFANKPCRTEDLPAQIAEYAARIREVVDA